MYKVLKRVRSNELGAMLHEISTGDNAEWKQWQGVLAMSKVSKTGMHWFKWSLQMGHIHRLHVPDEHSQLQWA